MALWTLHAAYDPESAVWYALDCDVPGLVTEERTIERLRNRAAAVVPDFAGDRGTKKKFSANAALKQAGISGRL